VETEAALTASLEEIRVGGQQLENKSIIKEVKRYLRHFPARAQP